MYNQVKSYFFQHFMVFILLKKIAVPAMILLIGSSLRAQSSRSGTEGGAGITSITNLHPPSRPAPPFGSINGSFDPAVGLQVSAAPGIASPQMTDTGQQQNAGGHRGVSPYTTVRTSARTASPQNASFRAMRVPHVAASQSALTASLPAAGIRPSLPASGTVDLRHAAAGVNGLQPAAAPRHSPASAEGPSRFARSNSIDGADGQGSTADPGASSVGESAYTSGTEDQGSFEASGFFESIKNPFAGVMSVPFGETQPSLNVEHACGDACGLQIGSSADSGSILSDASIGDSSGASEPAGIGESSHRDLLGYPGELSHSKLERTLGTGIFSPSEASGSDSRRLLKGTPGVLGSSGLIEHRKSSR